MLKYLLTQRFLDSPIIAHRPGKNMRNTQGYRILLRNGPDRGKQRQGAAPGSE